MDLLTSGSDWQYSMLVSGFILGTVIFILFGWQAIQNYRSVKQIQKFREKTNNIYEDKYAHGVIRTFEFVISFLWLAELIFFIVAEVLKTKFNNSSTDSKGTAASATAITHNIIFLVNAALIISYMGVAYYWNGSLIVVVDKDNLITPTAVCPKSAITVSRIIGSPKQLFKITYRDPDLKGNLKDFKLRYTKKLEAFLIKNGYYAGEEND